MKKVIEEEKQNDELEKDDGVGVFLLWFTIFFILAAVAIFGISYVAAHVF